MDDLNRLASNNERFIRAIELLENNDSNAATAMLQHCKVIPQDVFEAALTSRNHDFVRHNITRASQSTTHNILDQVIATLNVDLTQHIMAHVSADFYPFLTAVIRVYKKPNIEPMLKLLSPHLTATEKIILVRSLAENPNKKTPLTADEVQQRVNCITEGLDENRMWSIITTNSSARTKDVLTAAIDYHQNLRIQSHLCAPLISHSRKL